MREEEEVDSIWDGHVHERGGGGWASSHQSPRKASKLNKSDAEEGHMPSVDVYFPLSVEKWLHVFKLNVKILRGRTHFPQADISGKNGGHAFF
jgi:hypothetical protein